MIHSLEMLTKEIYSVNDFEDDWMIKEKVMKVLQIFNVEKAPDFPEYFEWALTHSSYANENGSISYERFEFLGDSIVGFTIAYKAFEMFKKMNEGELAKIKAIVGSEMVLSEVSKKIGLADLVLIGKSLNSAQLDELNSIYADVFESTTAAFFLNYGIDRTVELVSNLLSEKIYDAANKKIFFDYKTILQEYTQDHFSALPEYIMIEESGPSHKKKYTFEVKINDVVYGRGSGKSKKSAEQLAAQAAYERLKSI